MARTEPTHFPAPAFMSRWKHSNTGNVYEVLDPKVLGKTEPEGNWRVGVLYALLDRALDRATYWRSLEAFYASFSPIVGPSTKDPR